MNGAESLIRTLIDAGVDVCFANPGTTEMPMVRAIDETTGMRAVLCLFEGVCTGAADGYARMAEKPGLTLLHLGPGFANGVAYLHDARRARSPIINLIGEHATWHLAADAPSIATSNRWQNPSPRGSAETNRRKNWRATSPKRLRRLRRSRGGSRP
jgi:acetolactate synthase-1/2/3 large subunit